MTLEELLYPTKHLRYQICEFLIKKRREKVGRKNPIKIKYSEIYPLLEFAVTNENTREDVFLEELLSLEEEIFGDEPLIKITDKTILNNFDRWKSTESNLQIICTSERLREYRSELKRLTKVAIRELGLAEVKHLHTGGVEIILGDKRMEIGGSKIDNTNLSATLVKLMYHGKVLVLDQEFSIGNDYERNMVIPLDKLARIMSEINYIDIEDPINYKKVSKSIKDAIRNLNTRSLIELGRHLFELENNNLIWKI